MHDSEELIAGRPTDYPWPELDERSAAALCYISGTTGDPEGVAYSHRSVYLHSVQVNGAESFGLSRQERWTAVPAVPKTSVGKFDKKLLRSQHAAGDLSLTLLGRSVLRTG